jgi:hypothetical protein
MSPGGPNESTATALESNRRDQPTRSGQHLTRSVARGTAVARGRSIAAMLDGAWRPDVARRQASDAPIDAQTMDQILPLLLFCGSAGLVWRRLKHSTLRGARGVKDLQQASRLYALQSVIHDQSLAAFLRFLGDTGIEPILGKGWAIARLYPEAGLRPYGDVDLFVAADVYDTVLTRASAPGVPAARLDLHRGAADLDDRPFA